MRRLEYRQGQRQAFVALLRKVPFLIDKVGLIRRLLP